MAVFQRVWVVVLIGIFGAACGTVSAQVGSAPALTNPALPTLFLIGNADGAVEPALQSLFDRSKINVVDRSTAANGIRSTIESGAWAATLAMVRPGDFVLIQFGRTGASAADTESLPGVSDDARRAPRMPGTQAEAVVRSYGWYLRQYAVEVIARGATPILCAPLVADPTEQNRDGEWTRAIAVQQRLPFVDAAAAAGAVSATTDKAAAAIVAGLKGLPDDPLTGFFSAGGKAVPAYRPPPPTPASAAPTTPPL